MFATACLALGFAAGTLRYENASYAQDAEILPASGHFVVVPGFANSQEEYNPGYYVVTGDGNAVPVESKGRRIHVPKNNRQQLTLKHSFPSRISLQHSGRISD